METLQFFQHQQNIHKVLHAFVTETQLLSAHLLPLPNSDMSVFGSQVTAKHDVIGSQKRLLLCASCAKGN